jgi:adenosylcobinamide-phosphate synthase
MAVSLALGFLADQVVGDPPRWPHPVRGLGRLVEVLEPRLRSRFPDTPAGRRWAGRALVGITVGAAAGGAAATLTAARRVSPLLGGLAEVVLTAQALAAKDLREESMAVHAALAAGDLAEARWRVSRIVGRDTAALDEAGVARAAVETVAENTSDGVIAPLTYLALGGPAAAWAYKAVNTCDSMVGYRTGRYADFGRAAARLDDLVNWLPARLSGLLLVGAAGLTGLDARGAWRIWRRDRRRHASPNAGQPEAACAGALGVQLGGDASYFGEVHAKPTLGDDGRPVGAADIERANRLMLAASWLGLAVALAVTGTLPGRERWTHD